MNPDEAKKRFIAASRITSEDTTNIEKFKAVGELIKGLNPRVDFVLNKCSEAISKIEKLQQGEIIELSAESLPEKTDEEKRRKKAILLFIRSWKELNGEIERAKAEFDGSREKSAQEQVTSLGKIAAFAKGPFGILTLAAILIAGALIFLSGNEKQGTIQNSERASTSSKSKIQVIDFNGKKIALSEVEVREGPDCDSSHYHAKHNGVVRATDGSSIVDPGQCAFGRVREVQVEEIDAL